MRSNIRITTLSLQTLIFLSIVWPPFLANQILGLSGGGASPNEDGSIVRQIVYLALFTAAMIALVRHREMTKSVVRAINPWLWVFLVYAALSATWSGHAVLSIKRIALLLGTATVSLAFVASSIQHVGSKHQFFAAIRPLVTVLIVASLAYSLTLPQFGTHQEGAWRGLTFDKNTFGQAATLCSILWIISLREKAVRFPSSILLLGVSVLVLLLSRSTTSVVALTAALLSFLVFTCVTSLGRSFDNAGRESSHGVICLLALLMLILVSHIVALVLGYPAPIDLMEQIASHLGKDLTLTGRTYLWQLMWDEIMRHPWLGTGYHAFWETLDSSSPLTSEFTGGKGRGHNGYLDILNELGIVGSGLLIMVIFSHVGNLLRLHKIDPITAQGHIMILSSALLLNFAETALFQPVKLWSVVSFVSIMEVSCILKYKEITDYCVRRKSTCLTSPLR